MALIANILFPVDFSPSSVAMASYVKRTATLFGARVSLIHVVDLVSHNGLEMYVRPAPEISEEHLSIGRERLDSFLTAKFPVAECPRILGSGDPATEIAQTAANGRFDLIIMPTHSGMFRQMLLGSTTAKVLNDADCPVLTSQHAETFSPRPLEHRQLLCAIGLGSNSERVLRFAARLAQESQGKLTIIHAMHSRQPALPVELGLEEEFESAEKSEALRRIRELQRTVGSDAQVYIQRGSVKKAILEAAGKSDADVLMIGRGPRSGADGRMRDLTYAIIRDSPFPVLSV
jgi:nucleotide-binding universal stress UspA family protein